MKSKKPNRATIKNHPPFRTPQKIFLIINQELLPFPKYTVLDKNTF